MIVYPFREVFAPFSTTDETILDVYSYVSFAEQN